MIHLIRGGLPRSPRVQLRCGRGYYSSWPMSNSLWEGNLKGCPALGTCTTLQYHFYNATYPYRCIHESLLVLYQLGNYYGRYRRGLFSCPPAHSPFRGPAFYGALPGAPLVFHRLFADRSFFSMVLARKSCPLVFDRVLSAFVKPYRMPGDSSFSLKP